VRPAFWIIGQLRDEHGRDLLKDRPEAHWQPGSVFAKIVSEGDAMRKFLTGLLLALSVVVRPAQAASLTLGCSGTLTTTQVPKDKVASDPEKENVVDMSVVVNFDERTVSGFWTEMNGLHNALPITAIDANGVTFKGSKGSQNNIQFSIEGTIDRITGKIDATETWLWRTGSLSLMNYDLRCKHTKPLF
jgi:hypothetical protein